MWVLFLTYFLLLSALTPLACSPSKKWSGVCVVCEFRVCVLGDGTLLSQTLLWPSAQGGVSMKQPSLPQTQRVLAVPAGAEELSLGNLEGFVLEGCSFVFVFLRLISTDWWLGCF